MQCIRILIPTSKGHKGGCTNSKTMNTKMVILNMLEVQNGLFSMLLSLFSVMKLNQYVALLDTVSYIKHTEE